MSACPGCAGSFAESAGPTHRYMTGSPGCWHGFGGLLAADYSSAERMAVHQLVVDAYAAQHPGDGSVPQQVRSVGLHLMTLCLFLERGVDPARGTALHREMVGRPAFHRLVRSGPGALTWQHVPLSGPLHVVRAAVLEWGAAVWDTYRAEQPTVRTWLHAAGFSTSWASPRRSPSGPRT